MLRPGRNTNLGQKTFSRHWRCQKDQGGLATSPDCGALHVPLSLFQRLSGKRGRSKMLTPPWGQDTAAPPQNSSVAWGSSRAVFVPLFPHFNGDAVKVSTLKTSRHSDTAAKWANEWNRGRYSYVRNWDMKMPLCSCKRQWTGQKVASKWYRHGHLRLIWFWCLNI